MEVLVLPTAADVARRAAEVVIAGLARLRVVPSPSSGSRPGRHPLGLYAELPRRRARPGSRPRRRPRLRARRVRRAAGRVTRSPTARCCCARCARPWGSPPDRLHVPDGSGRDEDALVGRRRRVRATHRASAAASTCRSSASAPTATSASTSPGRRCRRAPGSSGCRTAPATTTPASSTASTTCRPTASPRGSAPCSTRAASSSSRPAPARRRPSRPRSRVRCRPRARPRCSSGTPTRPSCSTRRPRPGLRNRDYYDAVGGGPVGPGHTAYVVHRRVARGCGRRTGVGNFFSTARGQAFAQVTEHAEVRSAACTHSCPHTLSTAVDGVSSTLSTGCPQADGIRGASRIGARSMARLRWGGCSPEALSEPRCSLW